ncbi:hypothetical protein HPP92_007580 [Vanilla planifolia]|uniref:Pentatricopeptide repeat-containing protein n=1 Tax=Vanilla planifolia TaxID=51239 RepID=A0A835V9R4_VANPL|nr:hypothetical protein HPP92_007580 [Vanilla planifolia]
MMDSLCKAGRHPGASRIVYNEEKRFLTWPGFYNSIIHGLSLENGCMRAYQLFKEGITFRYSPFEPTYKVLVEALCKEKELQKAKYLVEFMLGIEGVDKTRIYNIFLNALCVMDNPERTAECAGVHASKKTLPS